MENSNQQAALFQAKRETVAIRLGEPGALKKLKQLIKIKHNKKTKLEELMFSLIITIISIALVAALALATIHYGGTAFNMAEEGTQAESKAYAKDVDAFNTYFADLFQTSKFYQRFNEGAYKAT